MVEPFLRHPCASRLNTALQILFIAALLVSLVDLAHETTKALLWKNPPAQQCKSQEMDQNPVGRMGSTP